MEPRVSLILYAHPFSSYCQKVLTALYENATPFEFRMLSPDNPSAGVEFAKLWPIKRMPVLRDGEQTLIEATVIIEHLDLCHRGPARLLPDDRKQALRVRFMDRVFDNYIMTPMQKIVGDHLRPADARDPHGVADARALLDTTYRWLETNLDGAGFACDDFSLADCAAAPSLFYADWVQPIGADCPKLRAYRGRLLKRPSFARAVEEARPFRPLFPPGAPDRD
jgi:glutathione S-transferase